MSVRKWYNLSVTVNCRALVRKPGPADLRTRLKLKYCREWTSQQAMTNQRLRGLMSRTGKFRHYSFGLLAAVTVAATAPLQALALDDKGPMPIEDAVIATEPATTVSEQAATVPTVKKKVKGPDLSDWQPPVPPKVMIPSPVDPEQEKQLAEKWGVKLISLNLTAAGYMIDFRFRVLDANKALPLFDHRIKPYIVVERSKAKLPVPMAAKVGAFRPTNRGKNIKADKNYYMVFGNPDHHVKSGEKVNLVIGDFKAENITVN